MSEWLLCLLAGAGCFEETKSAVKYLCRHTNDKIQTSSREFWTTGSDKRYLFDFLMDEFLLIWLNHEISWGVAVALVDAVL